jgi:hypothetical protein
MASCRKSCIAAARSDAIPNIGGGSCGVNGVLTIGITGSGGSGAYRGPSNGGRKIPVEGGVIMVGDGRYPDGGCPDIMDAM